MNEKPIITVQDTGKEFKLNIEMENLQLENKALEKALDAKARELMAYAEKMALSSTPKKLFGRIDREKVKAVLDRVAASTDQLLREKRDEIQSDAKLIGIEAGVATFGMGFVERVHDATNEKVKEVVVVADARRSTNRGEDSQLRQLEKGGY